jgi:nitrate reductase alpha subunit
VELDKLYDQYTINGAYKEGDQEKVADLLYRLGAKLGVFPKGTNLEEVRKRKGVPASAAAPQPFLVRDGERFPHSTLTRRMQFYLDHDWFVEAGEALPVHRPHPLLGGDYPFHQTGGHGRESVHSIWISNPLILRLTRGVPSLLINKEAAKRMGIEDFEEVEVYNDAGLYRVRVKHSSLMRPNQVAIYHCWEPYQFSKGHWNAVNPCTAKPLLLVSDYGHLTYVPGHWQPEVARRGARVNIKKLS